MTEVEFGGISRRLRAVCAEDGRGVVNRHDVLDLLAEAERLQAEVRAEATAETVKRTRVGAMRDQLWARLRPFLLDIERISERGTDGTPRDRDIEILVFCCVAAELRLRRHDAAEPGNHPGNPGAESPQGQAT